MILLKIWTFWEPPEKIPGYLRLCMRTWEKFLPDAEINLINYSNMRDYVDVDEYDPSLFSGRYRVDQIADALRALLLEKYGGIWLDFDTIILKDSAKKYFDMTTYNEGVEAVFFGNSATRGVHLAFINTVPHSKLMKYWIERAKDKIANFVAPRPGVFFAYLGNSIVDSYVKATTADEVVVLDRRLVMPELEPLPVTFKLKQHKVVYQDFFWNQKKHLADIDFDMLMLHNSWATKTIKAKNEKDFLASDCTMANILREILEL